ncbi:MAG TPA: phage tail protein [Acidisarcina sp.]|nr:phage tail protein [Acidisarcina sp.]
MQGKSQSTTRPTALGSLLQSSTYGSTIPQIYGQTQSALLAIWAANLRRGGSTKKLKQMKKGITAYVENVDFCIGHNPLMGVLQMWSNGHLYPLDFAVQSGSSWTVSDAHFYAVIAVTRTVTYNVTFNDYGGQGSVTLTGSYEIPMWNELEQGPDPTFNAAFRYWPHCYRWQPSYGATLQYDAGGAFVTGNINIYYARLKAATSYQPPQQRLRLAFESQLGSGTEYSDAGLAAQQIVYPQFAGMGSSSLDLGSSAAIPHLLCEVRGKFGIYPSGDCDFADIIEDVVKSGITQAAIGSGTAYTPLERGLSCYDLPGCVQQKSETSTEAFTLAPIPYNQPNTAGNFLVVIANGGVGAMSISDTAGNVWTPVFSGTPGYQVWYAKCAASGANTVTVTGQSYSWSTTLLEVAGVDTLDSVAVGSAARVTGTTTNLQDLPAYLLAIGLYQNGGGTIITNPVVAQWDCLTRVNFSGQMPASGQHIHQRQVRSGGSYTFVEPGARAPDGICMLAFKAVDPAPGPRPLGDFLDLPSLDSVRRQCRAYGLWGSLLMNAQQAAGEWLKTLYAAANAAPVYLGSKLYSFPYAEQSTAGNGANYTAPTASGPVAALDADNGDFVGSGPPVQLTTVSRIDEPNVLQMQCISRAANYAPVVVQQPEAAAIALYGVRKADPVVNNAVQDAAIARKLLAIQARRKQFGGDTYVFTVNSRWSLLAPMDLVTVTDRAASIVQVPVRITSTAEEQDGSLRCEAEPFVYGMCSPDLLAATTPTQNTVDTNASAGNVNAPVIFEPVPRLYGNAAQAQLWLAVSSPAANYGGAQVFLSTDGGSSYNPVGDPLTASAITGVSTADWPAAADPDTVNNLALDLTESAGTLLSYQVSDEDNFLYPCYIAGGGSYAIAYELMSYAAATLTAANKYTLQATGTGNKLRRAVYAAPATGAGVDHPLGSRFAFLSPDGSGLLKLTMDPTWIGKTLKFKICSFNSFGGGLQSLADVVVYSYTPTGAAASAGGGGQGFQVNGA